MHALDGNPHLVAQSLNAILMFRRVRHALATLDEELSQLLALRLEAFGLAPRDGAHLLALRVGQVELAKHSHPQAAHAAVLTLAAPAVVRGPLRARRHIALRRGLLRERRRPKARGEGDAGQKHSRQKVFQHVLVYSLTEINHVSPASGRSRRAAR